ncbi:GntR family transcriptional regulator [Pseudidiomarina sp. 1APR75-15]|uniref:GntR family transcriptional regulator n=1 Tax=Pseudidiomarina terrestris TaxID=2820060 RepID=A0ABT8MI75_9GAMM|nr:GntR family transcriptional regulator [Pseudidiomarina sp. 1APR75-15]MDN7129647.1 GntR family transcriptional regulator [Pseudidiomarina sp. 1APR75-15]
MSKHETSDPYGMIMDAIVTQKLPPSQKVSENILSETFGISRAIARNMMERLVAQHFLVTLSPRVTQVAPLTLLEIRQNFMLRRMMLPEVISLAGAKADFDKIDSLNKKIANLIRFKDDDSALELLKTNKELNMELCEPVGYPLMIDWIRQLEDTAMRIYWLYVKTKQSFPYSSDQQNIIIDVVRSDDSKRIQTCINDMIMQTEERVLNAIFQNKQFYTQDLIV